MREIALSKKGKNKGKYVALVDDADYDYLNKWGWQIFKKNDTSYYAVREISLDGVTHKIQMHRLILGLTDPKIQVDHKDHDGLNNQRSNLREASNSQNGANRRCAKNSTSKYLGVHIPSKSYYGNRWAVTISINRKTKYVGCFKTEEQAARAYDEAAKIYHGEFANLNFK